MSKGPGGRVAWKGIEPMPPAPCAGRGDLYDRAGASDHAISALDLLSAKWEAHRLCAPCRQQCKSRIDRPDIPEMRYNP